MSNNLTLAIERRWRLRAGLGRFVPLLLALHVVVLLAAFFGMALSYTLFLANAGPHLLPHAFFAMGLSLLVAMGVAELLSRWVFHGWIYFGIALATVCAVVVVRLLLGSSPVGGSFFAFVIAEISFALLVRRLRTVALLVFDEFEWGRLSGFFLPIQAAGGIVGALLLLPWVSTGRYESAVWLWAILSLGTVVLTAMAVAKLPRRSTGVVGTFDLPASRWRGILATYPVVGALAVISIVGRIVRYAIQANTFAFFGERVGGAPVSLGLLIVAVVAANAVIVSLFTLSTERISQRIGVGATAMIYAVVRLTLLILWVFVPASWTVALLVSLSWFSLMPGLQLTYVRQVLVLLPKSVIGAVRTLIFIVCTAVGAFVAGLILLFYPTPLDGREAIAWTAVAAAVVVALSLWTALLLRRRWKSAFRGKGLGLEALDESSDAVPAQPAEIEQLLAEEDPESIRIGFFLAARNQHPQRYVKLAQEALPRATTPACRSAALEYLKHVPPEQLAQLLTSDVVQVRARALAAVALHKIPVGIVPVTSRLRDDDTWVQLLACAAAWRLGMGKLAAAAWEGLNLSDIDENGLLEFLEIIRRGAPLETLRVLKQLTRFPSPRVREAAIHTLGLALQGVVEGHADVYEVALRASLHEEPRIRAAAVDLLVASGADNRVEHVARLIEDPSDLVRKAAARGLSQLDLPGIEAAASHLSSLHPWVVESAIWALAASGKPGRDLLDRWFKPRLDDFASSLKLPPCLREEGGIWTPISLAMQNRQRRLLLYLVAALDGMGLDQSALALQQLTRPQLKEVRGHLAQLIRREAPRRYAAVVDKELITTLHDPVDPALYTHHPLVLSYLEQAMKQSIDPFLQQGAQAVWAAIHHKEFPVNRLLFLKGVPYFADLLLEELLVIDEQLHQEAYAKGEIIFKEGSPGDRFYIIWKGSVALTRANQKIATLEQGAYFAEMSLFEEAPRSATATAATNCTLLSLEKQAFQTLVLQRPTILLHICRELSHRLRHRLPHSPPYDACFWQSTLPRSSDLAGGHAVRRDARNLLKTRRPRGVIG